MATRSEQHHAEEQRRGGANKTRAKRSKPGVAPKNRSRAKPHAARKATYALEHTASGQRPSRKSSRKSANRAKADSGLTLTDALRKGSPASRFRKAQARASRVRGNGGGARP